MAEVHTIKQEPEDLEDTLETFSPEEGNVEAVDPSIVPLLEIKVESEPSHSEVLHDESVGVDFEGVERIKVEPEVSALLEIGDSSVSMTEEEEEEEDEVWVEKKEAQSEGDNNGKKWKHRCTVCNRTFPYLSTLQRHKVVHTGDRPYSCDQCHKTFAYRPDWKVHVMLHLGVKRYSCKTCHRTFSYSSELKRHIFVHTGQKPHACTVCSKTFTQRSNMRRHMSIHS